MNDTEEISLLNRKMETWLNRAAMAYQQTYMDLAAQALERRWQFQKELAVLLGEAEPPHPPSPEEFFRDRGSGGTSKGDPNTPSRVPRIPYPSFGAGALALPEPTEQDTGN